MATTICFIRILSRTPEEAVSKDQLHGNTVDDSFYRKNNIFKFITSFPIQVNQCAVSGLLPRPPLLV